MKFPGKHAFKTLKTKFVLYSVLPLPIQRKRFFHQLCLKKKKKKSGRNVNIDRTSKQVTCLSRAEAHLKFFSLMWSFVTEQHSGPGLWWNGNCKNNMVQMVKNPPAMWETWIPSLDQEDPLLKGLATHSSILAGRIPQTEELGELQSMGSQKVR